MATEPRHYLLWLQKLAGLLTWSPERFPELLDQLLAAILEMVTAERALILLLDEQGGRRVIQGRRAGGQPLAEMEIKVSLAAVGRVLKTGEPIFVADVKALDGLPDSDSLEELGTRTLMCLPLTSAPDLEEPGTSRRDVFGLIYVDSTRELAGFSPEQRAAFEAAASFTASLFQLQRWYQRGAIEPESGLTAPGHFLLHLAGACQRARRQGDPLTLAALALRSYPDLCRRQGATTGRAAIQEAARRLREAMGGSRRLARCGPFHFYAAFPGQEPEEVLTWLREQFPRLAAPEGKSGTPLSWSAGLASFPDQADNSRELAVKAEQALTAALGSPEGILSWEIRLGDLEPAQRLTALLTGNTYRDYRNVSTVLEMLKTLHEASRLPEALEHFLDRMMEFSGADEAYLFLAGGDGVWKLRARRPSGKIEGAQKSRLDAIQARISECPGESPGGWQFTPLEGSLSLGWLPLRVQDESVGQLALVGQASRLGIDASDQPFFDALAREVSFFLFWALRAEKEEETLRRENEELRSSLCDRAEMMVESPEMRALCRKVDRMADNDLPVLIFGESGTGKEMLARRLHRLSSRRDKPFVVVDCPAIPSSLFESELFGHEPGAFTGATEQKPGLSETASGGTLFLDEVGELPLEVQAKLLRLLQEKKITRVGGTVAIPVNIRVMAATHRRLEEEVAAGRFREDLYFRLKGFVVTLPPLRERKLDILPLARHFLQQAALKNRRPRLDLSPEAEKVLQAAPWRGNIRELENKMEMAATLASGDRIHPPDLSLDEVAPEGLSAEAREYNYERAQLDWQYAFVTQLLSATRGNVTRAATLAGISRAALNAMINRAGVDRDRLRPGAVR